MSSHTCVCRLTPVARSNSRLQTWLSSCLTVTTTVVLLPNEAGPVKPVCLSDGVTTLPFPSRGHLHIVFYCTNQEAPPPLTQRVTSCLRWRDQLLLKRAGINSERLSFPPQVPTAPSRFLPTRPSGPVRSTQRPAWPELPTRRWWTRASCGSSEATSSTPPTTTWSKREYPQVWAAVREPGCC